VPERYENDEDREIESKWSAIAMEARQGGNGGTRLHPKDDSAARRDRPETGP
jgi:hypothetical protein